MLSYAPMSELIIGGARSGKSLLAETRAGESGLRVIYVATARVHDSEMECRIAHHKARRPAGWGLFEAPIDLPDALRRNAAANVCLLVDCLTLWLSNLFFEGQAARQAETDRRIDCPFLAEKMRTLIEMLPLLPGRVILVSNEVGCGIVPASPISRLFADEQGRLNQRVAAVCEKVTFVAAGLPLELKS
ncbi:MAG: bifunctional adenosylcobinamide kinase/adenosylcobinamide-phosphate guanylyltransferase [Candidatus Accumulibacter sp.]|jgi:adenosylcobinamide kinase/adenosylcobinamide-phosphate guanylyltransferase|nr:bifunctional adenosylcobinamide kinase/adenosylcobinamide-phosphate guanylyltransferase [Accumulibacter sp.]